MSRYHLLFTRYALYLIIGFSLVRSEEVKCEKNATSHYVCIDEGAPMFSRDCCYNYELSYYYCCTNFQYRSQSYVERFIGLIVAAVVTITMVCLLCIFFERCPGRWYLKKCMQRRDRANEESQ